MMERDRRLTGHRRGKRVRSILISKILLYPELISRSLYFRRIQLLPRHLQQIVFGIQREHSNFGSHSINIFSLIPFK